MITCKSCQHEFEGKFCPQCGVPAEGDKPKNPKEKLLEDIDEIKSQVGALSERFQKLDERTKERLEKKKKTASKGVIDSIFS